MKQVINLYFLIYQTTQPLLIKLNCRMKHTKIISMYTIFKGYKTSDRFMFAQYHIQKLFTYIIRIEIKYADIVHIYYSIFILKGEFSTGCLMRLCARFLDYTICYY